MATNRAVGGLRAKPTIFNVRSGPKDETPIEVTSRPSTAS